MNNYRYILEKGSKKHHCPDCGKKRFVRFIDTETNNYLPDQYGRCDRESKCTYQLDPYTDGYAKKSWEQEHGQYNNDWKPKRPPRKVPPTKPEPYPIPFEVLKETLTGYEHNIFIQNLLTRVPSPFEVQDIEKAILLYKLGTIQNGYLAGANTFPFIDANGKIRAIQVKQFDEQNHSKGTPIPLNRIIENHHTRNNKPLPEWIESYNKNDSTFSCLFGEHLLKRYPRNPIALVEAPKTAIYGTLYFGFPEQPQNLLWLAVYNLSSLTLKKCKALKGRDVFLFPDLSEDGKAFTLWSNKAKQIQKQLPGTYFKVSDLLERLAPEDDRSEGNDIADFLIKQDWREFRNQSRQEPPVIKSDSTTKKEIMPQTAPIHPQIEVYSLDDLINGIKIPKFTGTREEYKMQLEQMNQ